VPRYSAENIMRVCPAPDNDVFAAAMLDAWAVRLGHPVGVGSGYLIPVTDADQVLDDVRRRAGPNEEEDSCVPAMMS
jgi:hypothetical protein